jgi:hypothetical protein
MCARIFPISSDFWMSLTWASSAMYPQASEKSRDIWVSVFSISASLILLEKYFNEQSLKSLLINNQIFVTPCHNRTVYRYCLLANCQLPTAYLPTAYLPTAFPLSLRPCGTSYCQLLTCLLPTCLLPSRYRCAQRDVASLQLPTAYCHCLLLLPTATATAYLPTAYCLLAYCLLAYCLLAYCQLLTCLPPSAYCLLPTAYLPTAICLLPTELSRGSVPRTLTSR